LFAHLLRGAVLGALVLVVLQAAYPPSSSSVWSWTVWYPPPFFAVEERLRRFPRAGENVADCGSEKGCGTRVRPELHTKVAHVAFPRRSCIRADVFQAAPISAAAAPACRPLLAFRLAARGTDLVP